MIKKTLTYTDFDGVERTEDFYFNLTEAELMEMEGTTEGGLSNTIRRMIDAQDRPEIMALFKKLLLQSYGEKSPDGKRFMKSEEISRNFSYTQAYSDLYVELSTNDKAASDFVNGIVPARLVSAAADESGIIPIEAGNN